VPLSELFDVALLDLDGTVYVGHRGIPGAAAAVAAARDAGLHPLYVTNNAARTPQVVAAQLTALGLAAAAEDVVTSAQAGARLVRERLQTRAPVLVVGGDGLRSAVAAEGLEPVSSAENKPLAVVQGWAPELAWPLLAEAAYALATGLPWIATNTDRTLPTDRGVAPGNGSFVALLSGVVGRSPDAVAGKPSPALLSLAVSRAGATRPLAVGDRLDTDIAGANAAGLPSLLVLTGVTGPADLLVAVPEQRPTYVSRGLTGLLAAHPAPTAEDGAWSCGQASAAVDDGVLRVRDAGDPLDRLRAACAAVWAAADAGHAVDVEPAAQALGVLLDEGVSPASSGA
jgi:HAD superfamily hydrolase (TIGR01450 family)